MPEKNEQWEVKKPGMSDKARDYVKRAIRFAGPILLCVMLVTFLMTTVLLRGTVESDSMSPALKKGQTVYGFRLAYLYEAPQRGDIVVFRSPEDDTLMIKRVIGVPGDVIEFVSGRVYINNEELKEPYARGVTLSDDEQDIYYVPDRCVFLMGDNREYSEDARYWERPYVTIAMIKAKLISK